MISVPGRIISKVFIACFLARGVLIVARRCSSAKRRTRAAFTSMVDSDSDPRPASPGHPTRQAVTGLGPTARDSFGDHVTSGMKYVMHRLNLTPRVEVRTALMRLETFLERIIFNRN